MGNLFGDWAGARSFKTFLKGAKGNKLNEYDSCNKMVIIVMTNFNFNSVTLQLQTSLLHREFATIAKPATIFNAKGKLKKPTKM